MLLAITFRVAFGQNEMICSKVGWGWVIFLIRIKCRVRKIKRKKKKCFGHSVGVVNHVSCETVPRRLKLSVAILSLYYNTCRIIIYIEDVV